MSSSGDRKVSKSKPKNRVKPAQLVKRSIKSLATYSSEVDDERSLNTQQLKEDLMEDRHNRLVY
jgi:hypothetical protein